MKRREFITLVGGAAAAWPLAVSLGTPTLAREPPKIIILHSGFPNRTPIHLLFEALSKLGYENDRTATIDLLGGEGDPNRLRALRKIAAFLNLCESDCHNRIRGCGYDGSIRFF
jgi:putative ABC transport system substrate-binding protein